MLQRKKAFVLFLLCLVFFDFGVVEPMEAETFRNPQRIPLAVDPAGVTTGDLNGDGRNDIVWTENKDYPANAVLHVLLATTSGPYISAPDVIVAFYSKSIQCIIEEVTGDKRNDLVCVGVTGDNGNVFLITYPGNGDGTFALPLQTKVVAPVTFSWPILARAGDLNHDGVSDVIVTDAFYSGTLPYLSDGQGGFKAAAMFQGSFNYSVPTVTDLNGDGKLDILWPTGPRVSLGNGDGSFSAPTHYDPGYLSNCAFGDVDGDGHLDAACTWFDGGDIDGYVHLTVLHGFPDGSFDKTPLFTRTFGNGENENDGLATILSPVLVADLNGDGYADIVSLSGDGYCVLLGGPNSTWNGPPQQFISASFKSQGGLSGIYGVSIADMNGDGVPDIVAIGPNGLYITYAQRDGTLSSAPAPELGQVSTSATLVDVNGDGNLDVVSAGDTALKLSLGRGDGTFNSPQPITTSGNFGAASNFTGRVISGDFNGDGKQDLLATGSVAVYTSENYILFGHGDGTFDALRPVSISLGKVADVNNDGRSDVFSINNDSSATNVLVANLSRGDGTFSTVSTNLPTETTSNGFVTASRGPALADFRHSGRLDAAVLSFKNAYMLRSHGDGSFDSIGTTLAIPDLPNLTKVAGFDIATGDFDGDGNPDVAALVQYGSGIYYLSTTASAVWVFYGNGDGTFSTAVLAGTFNRDAQTLTAGDLNGDGLADIVLTSYGAFRDNGVLIVHALPNRTWGPETDYTGGEGLSPLWISDINHDGRNDLIFSNAGRGNYSSNSISVLLNQVSNTVTGTLTAAPEPSNVTYPFIVHARLTPFDPADVLAGNVTFAIDGTVVGTAPVSGNTSSLNLSGLSVAAGTHSLSASWPGDAIYPPVTLSGTHAVSLLPLTISLAANPASLTVGGIVTATARFDPGLMPTVSSYQFTGMLTMSDNGVVIAQQQVSRNGFSFTLSALPMGIHTLSVSYPGDTLFAAAQSNSVTVIVAGAVTTSALIASPASSIYGKPINLTATVTSVSPGTISGAVNFYTDGNFLNSVAVIQGFASVSTASLKSGIHSLTCAYSGDSTFAASSCAPVSVTVRNGPTVVTLVSSANPAPALSFVTFTANLTSQSKPFSLNVPFYVDGVYIKSIAAAANGTASYTTVLSAATHTVQAQFPGTDGYDPSNASVTEVVVPNPTTTSLTPPGGTVYQNQVLTLIAYVKVPTGTSSPNGTVTLSEGAVVLAQATTQLSVSGSTTTILSLTLTLPASGTHFLTATYTPADGNFLSSTSQVLSVAVVPEAFTLSISTPALSIPTEHHKSFSASVQSLGAFVGPVQLTCAVPQTVYLTCTVSNPVLQLAANSSATSEVTLDTDAVLRFKSSRDSGPRRTAFDAPTIAVALLLPLPLVCVARRRGYRSVSLMLLLFGLGTMVALAGCSGKYPGHTPPGSYDIVITATGTSAGSAVAIMQTAHMQLTVTPE